MIFNNSAEALQFYVMSCATDGVCYGVPELERKEENDIMVNRNRNTGLLAELIHTKIDIEKLFKENFPEKWIQRVMLRWGVDGYESAIDGSLGSVSRYHSSIPRRSRERLLAIWINRLTASLEAHGYVKRTLANAHPEINKKILDKAGGRLRTQGSAFSAFE